MIIINYVLVFVFISITTGFRIDLQNEGKIKSPFYRTFNRIRRSEDSKEVQSEDDMEVAESRFIPQAFHSYLPFPPTHHGYHPGGYPHFGHHQHMFGHSGWHDGDRDENRHEGYGYNRHHGYGHGHVHGVGCGHDLSNDFHHHHHHGHNDINKVDKSTPTSVINPGEVTTPSTSTTSEIYDIDVRLGS